MFIGQGKDGETLSVSVPVFASYFNFHLLDDKSLTSANLGNDHGFMNKEYSLEWYELFWGSPKESHELMFKVDNIISLWRVVFV